jgi:hypothetical protein
VKPSPAFICGGGLRSDNDWMISVNFLHTKLGKHGKDMQTTYDSLNRKGCLEAHPMARGWGVFFVLHEHEPCSFR